MFGFEESFHQTETFNDAKYTTSSTDERKER